MSEMLICIDRWTRSIGDGICMSPKSVDRLQRFVHTLQYLRTTWYNMYVVYFFHVYTYTRIYGAMLLRPLLAGTAADSFFCNVLMALAHRFIPAQK